jgi:hypothetical protein
MTVTGGGSTYPIEQTKSSGPIIKKDNSQEQNNDTCITPQLGKKNANLPYPTLTGIEGQLEESFKNFKGNLEDAREKTSILTGVKSQQISDQAEILSPSASVMAEGSSVSRLSDIARSNSQQ